jgi:hypothetical protein
MTSTERTAVEQALITQASSEAICSFKFDELQGRKFILVADELIQNNRSEDKLENRDLPFILSRLTNHLLEAGMELATDYSQAEVSFHPRIDYAQIDDSDFLIGMPTIPLPVPGVGTVETPEMALFGNSTQYGRAKFSLYGVDRKTGKLIFNQETEPSQKHYSRWSALLIFGWRTTNLDPPF